MFTTAYLHLDPLAIIRGALWTFLGALGALLAYWRPIALCAALGGAVALCLAFPALPAGLAIIGGYAWVTMPRAKAVSACC